MNNKFLKCFLFIITFYYPVFVFSQTAKINTGITMSSINHSLFDDNIHPFAFSIEYDYLKKNIFFLSSEIGYIRKGAQNSEHDLQLQWDYLHFNTSINTYYQFDKTMVYFGVGTKIDIKIKENDIAKGDKELKKVIPGAIFSLGIVEYLTPKLSLGIRAGYLVDFMSIGNIVSKPVYDKCFLFFISLGYKI
jgi:hypothetical protein